MRRAPRDQVAEWCEAYFYEFGLHSHVLWQHEVANVTTVKPMLHKVTINTWVDQVRTEVTMTVFTRSVLVCTGDNYYSYVPHFEGQESASFPIKHNLDIRDANEIPTSGVVIIGAGPSAMDMVQEACLTRGGTDVQLVHRTPHWGAPDTWWPWMWQFGFSELHFLRIMFKMLPIFVVDTIAFYVCVLWTWYYQIPEWCE